MLPAATYRLLFAAFLLACGGSPPPAPATAQGGGDEEPPDEEAPGEREDEPGTPAPEEATEAAEEPEEGSGSSLLLSPPGTESGGYGSFLGLRPDGEPLRGELTAVDPTGPRGRHFDQHGVELEAGQGYVVALRSPSFDTYLYVTAPGGREWVNDDYEGLNSQVAFVAPEAGRYAIRVTSFAPGEQGPYELTVRAGQPEDAVGLSRTR